MFRSHLAFAAAACFAPDDGSAGADVTGPLVRNVTIAGETFSIKAPYEAGHQLNEAEASQLNQVFLENIRNNLAGKIKAGKETAETNGTSFSLDAPVGGDGPDAAKSLRQICSEYADAYEFGVRRTSTAEPADPVEREARSIAREAMLAKLRKSGTKRKDIPEEVFEEALAKHSKNPQIVAEAKRRVKVRESIGLDELDLGESNGSDGADGSAEGAEG